MRRYVSNFIALCILETPVWLIAMFWLKLRWLDALGPVVIGAAIVAFPIEDLVRRKK